MSEKYEKFAKALDDLISQGDMLLMAMQFDCYGGDFAKKAKEKLGEEKSEKYLKSLPNSKKSIRRGILKHRR